VQGAFDTLELIARVRSTLRRNQEFREVQQRRARPGIHAEQ
jgi:DNA-binding response OmpR family regulator